MILEQVFVRTLSRKEHDLLQASLQEVQAKLRRILKTGQCSFVFMSELAACFASRELYDPYPICDELERLEGCEGASITKVAQPFTRSPLKGLWHKHFFQARFMTRNLLLETSRPGAMEEIFAPFLGRYTDEVAGELAYAMTVEMYEKRASERRLTGEWIIFERCGNANYYLTLAEHREGDVAIKDRIDLTREIDEKLRSIGRG